MKYLAALEKSQQDNAAKCALNWNDKQKVRWLLDEFNNWTFDRELANILDEEDIIVIMDRWNDEVAKAELAASGMVTPWGSQGLLVFKNTLYSIILLSYSRNWCFYIIYVGFLTSWAHALWI
jgi:hypothetical protein